MRIDVRVTPEQVSEECRLRILERYDEVTQMNALRGKDEVDWDWIDRMRVRCSEIKAMNPIPANYTDDSIWI